MDKTKIEIIYDNCSQSYVQNPLYNCIVVTKYGFSCDKCLKDELEFLNSIGIKTVGSCCGHHVDCKDRGAYPFIQVDDESVKKMIELNYKLYPITKHGNGENCFAPKTI